MADTIIEPEPAVSPFYVLAVGRTVHYVNGIGKHCSATVTEVRDKINGTVDLVVFGGITIGNNWKPEPAALVEWVAFGESHLTWHWPERVGE